MYLKVRLQLERPVFLLFRVSGLGNLEPVDLCIQKSKCLFLQATKLCSRMHFSKTFEAQR